MSHFWHPFSDLAATLGGDELIIDRGEGYHVFDENGNRYVDATASLWYCNVGHGREQIAEAARRQMSKLEAYSTFGTLANRPVIELAERLSFIAPVSDSLVFLTSGGSDSIDTSIKLARRYFHLIDQPDRRFIISRLGSYHGMHLAGTSIGGIAANADGYGELFGETRRVQWDSVEAFESLVTELGPEHVAAFVCEPIIGAGGVFPPPVGYLEKAREICRQTGILFIADEVISGFGRVGAWFASERFGLDPDVVVCAKGVTSGYLPMGAVLVAPWIAEAWVRRAPEIWRHGYTYSGHATVAAAALANLDIIEEDRLLDRAKELEGELATALARLSDHQLVSQVRAGTGAMAAVQLDPDIVGQDPMLPGRVIAACREAGVMTRLLAGNGVHISPPLTLDEPGLAEMSDGILVALDRALEN